MPLVDVIYYKDDDGSVPVREWLRVMYRRDRKIVARCQERLEQLEEFGSDLRRPVAENLGDGIYELRIKVNNIHYRIFYFFHGRTAAIVAHSLNNKEGPVPSNDIAVAKRRRDRYFADPEAHRYEEE